MQSYFKKRQHFLYVERDMCLAHYFYIYLQGTIFS